jgi:hypothetical protein
VACGVGCTSVLKGFLSPLTAAVYTVYGLHRSQT